MWVSAAALFPGFLGSLKEEAAAQHREQGGRCLPHHPYFLHSLQLALELDDGLPDGHTLSLVPESLEAKRALPWEKREPDASGEYYQITEPFIDRMWRWPYPANLLLPCSFFFFIPGSVAGTQTELQRAWTSTARLAPSSSVSDSLDSPKDFANDRNVRHAGNNCNIHAGTVRQTPRPRRSLGMTFYTSADPPLAAARRARPDDGRADKTPQFWERFVCKFPDLLRWVPMVEAEAGAKL